MADARARRRGVATLSPVEAGLGCVNLGSASAGLSEQGQIRLIRTAIDHGVTIFDTADVYGAGASERLLGRAVRNRRDGLTISTKGGYVFDARGALAHRLRRIGGRTLRAWHRTGGTSTTASRAGYAAQDFSAANLRRRAEASLRRLNVDRIDVYQLHGPPAHVEGLLTALDDLRAAGAIGRFGVGAESVEVAISWADESLVDVVQIPFGVLDPDARDKLLATRGDRGPRIWARGVLGGGVIAAAMDERRRLGPHPKATLIKSLANIASDAGMEIDELAIRWARTHAGISAVLLGMSSTAHLWRNLELLGRPPLDDALMQRVAEVTSELRA
jgi:aryl-alcohol dehydrogenase-like predicted oxidoreductase